MNWSWSDMVTSARHVPRDCGVRRTSTESEFRLRHFDRLILLSDSKLDPLLNFNISILVTFRGSCPIIPQLIFALKYIVHLKKRLASPTE